MKQYIGTKIVSAEPMSKNVWLSAKDGSVSAYAKDEQGYKVVYEDGYTSWSPKETFERAYTEVTHDEIMEFRVDQLKKATEIKDTKWQVELIKQIAEWQLEPLLNLIKEYPLILNISVNELIPLDKSPVKEKQKWGANISDQFDVLPFK